MRDAAEIKQYVLNQLENAEIQDDPYPHFIIDGLLPEDFYQELISHLPDRADYQKVTYPGTGHDPETGNYHDYGWAYRDLSKNTHLAIVGDIFGSDEFSRLMLDKFSAAAPGRKMGIPEKKHKFFKDGAEDFTSVYDHQIDLPGYEIAPHRDIEGKIVTYLFYMTADDSLERYGTYLCKPHSDNPSRSGWEKFVGRFLSKLFRYAGMRNSKLFKRMEHSRFGLKYGIGASVNWLPWEKFDLSAQAPALPNHLLSFAPNEHSYHAVRLDIPADNPSQERPMVRGFIRDGKDTSNWIRSAKI